jgi:hypothetical protein
MSRSVMTYVRHWWPVPALLATAIVTQQIYLHDRYDVSGHAAEHLNSATVMFPAFALIAILLFVTPSARRQPLVLVACAVWLGSTVLVFIGNIRVVDTLVRNGLADVSTSDLVMTDAIASAHDLADAAPWLGVVSALAVIGALWRLQHVSGRVATGATMLSVIFPPWIFPGLGVVVVTVARCIARHRFVSRRNRAGERQPATTVGGRS